MKKGFLILALMLLNGVAYAQEATHIAEEAGLPLVGHVAVIVIALLIALGITGSMKGKLKTARLQTHATNYLKKDSLKLTIKTDHRR